MSKIEQKIARILTVAVIAGAGIVGPRPVYSSEINAHSNIATAHTAALGLRGADGFSPKPPESEGEWQPTWGYSTVGVPLPVTGSPEERVPLSLLTNEGNTMAVTCGPVEYQDPYGVKVSFPGGADRASLVIVKDAIGAAGGGVDVNLLVVPKYNWVGATVNPDGGLQPVHLEDIAREREASLRSPNGGNFTGSQIDVMIINGRNGAIEETRTMFPLR